MILTDEQKHIIDLSKTLKNNEILAIQACAGSGKTSTLREIALANPNAKFLYLAFNKAIVTESHSKFPKNVNLKTIHSLAYSYMRNEFGNFNVANKLNVFDLNDIMEFEGGYKDTALAIKFFDDFLRSDKTFNDYFPNKELIKFLFEATLERKLPITHNFYLKIYEMASNKRLDTKYDFILLDEAQDTNEVMLSVFLKNNCKKILVGDTFQNIYGFNNSINAFEIIKANYDTTLSKSFRCKQQILDYANFLLDKFANKSFKAMTSGFKENNEFETKAFITRTNAGIINFLDKMDDVENLQNFCLLKEPDKIFAPLWAIIHFRNGKFDSIPKEYAYIKQFNNTKELYKYIGESQEIELEKAIDILNGDIDLKKVTKLANKLFYNKEAKQFIINAHQAKGLEWDIVELKEDFPNLIDLESKVATEDTQRKREERKKQFEQELNLFYVAITRAKKKLIDDSSNIMLYKNNLKDDVVTYKEISQKQIVTLMNKIDEETRNNNLIKQKQEMTYIRHYK